MRSSVRHPQDTYIFRPLFYLEFLFVPRVIKVEVYFLHDVLPAGLAKYKLPS